MPSKKRPPLTDAQREAAAANLPLVYWFARQWLGRISDRDGYISNLHLALCRAVRGHDPDKGALATYAVACFHRATIDFIQAEARRSKRAKSLTPMLRDRGSDCVHDPLGIDAEQGQSSEAEAVTRYRQLRNELTRRECAVIMCRGNAETLETISRRQGISRERIRQIAKRAVLKMRELAAGRKPRRVGRPVTKASKLTPERGIETPTAAMPNRSKQQREYLRRRAKGLCVRGCGRKAVKGYTSCMACKEKARLRRATS